MNNFRPIYRQLLIGLIWQFVLLSISAQVKEYASYIYSIDQGLSQNSINCILKDKRGFIWFGTEDGLNRFDGQEVTVFSSKDGPDVGLLDNTVYCLLEDTLRNDIYIGTSGGGLSVFDPLTERFRHYTYDKEQNSISSDFIYALSQDQEGNILIASSYGVSIFDPEEETFDNYIADESEQGEFPYVAATALWADDEGVIWVGTYGQGIVRINTKEREIQRYQISASADYVYNVNIIEAIKSSSDKNKLWLATDGGCYIFDKTSQEFTLKYWKDVKVSDIVFDVNNGMWLSSGSHGLLYVTPDGKTKHYKNDPYDIHSLKEDYIRSLYLDERGHLWIGTKSSGCIHMNISDTPFTHYYQTKDGRGINGTSVYSLDRDQSGQVWIGTMQGLSVWNPNLGTITPYYPIEEEDQLSAWTLYNDDDLIWIGTSRGLLCHNKVNKLNKLFAYIEGDSTSLPDNEVFAIERDRDGYFWIGTAYGLARFNSETGTFSHYPFKHINGAEQKEMVWDIHCDSYGRIWVSTQYGVNLYQPKSDSFDYLFGEKGDSIRIVSSSVSSIYEDSHKRIWLASSTGVYLVGDDLKLIKHYGLEEGLVNDYTYKVFEHDSVLWVTSNKGISQIDLQTDIVNNFDVQDGLQSNEFNSAAERLSDGRLIFGGINGINVFHPDSIKQSSYIPPVYFTSFELYGQPVSVRDTTSFEDIVIKSSVIAANNLYLAPEERFFTLNFAALDYQDPREIQYFYRMLPNSKDWIPLNNKRNLTFSDLNSGKYTLQVRSTNAEGFICNNVKSLNIVVNPPFWQTSWFIVLVALAILLIVYFLGRLYYLRLQRDKEILEKRVSLRTKEFQLQRNIAHRQRDEIIRQKEELEGFAKNLEGLVDERTEELKLAKEAAEESDRLKSAFLSNMSHEIRTPMNAIMGFSELLLDGSFSNEEKNDFAKLIRSNGDNLLHLLNDIIDISMIESGQLKIAMYTLDASALISEVFESFYTSKVLKEKPRVSYELKCPDEPLLVLSDNFRLRQILNNLIGNALKFTASGYVKVKLVKEGRFARFSVEDSGIGISMKHQSRIFDRFLKVENNTADLYAGNGLGLTITKNLVELLDGKIGLESELGVGTNFFFYLPLANND